LSHAQVCAPLSWYDRISATSATPPQCQPNSLPVASVTISTTKKSSSVHCSIQACGARSTPEACSRRQPGGRCRVADNWLKSCSQPVAESLRASRSTRLSAMMLAVPRRNSIPGGALASSCVMY
jgi:hypothetical protein